MATLMLHRSPRRSTTPRAPPTAPESPRAAFQASRGVKEALGGRPASFWAGAHATEFTAHNSPRTRAFDFNSRPSAVKSVLNEGEPDEGVFTSHTHRAHAAPAETVRPEVVKRNANEPSQFDHPFLGLHNPLRRTQLATLTALNISANSSQFLPPPRYAYQFEPAPPPYPATAHLALRFDGPSNPDAAFHRMPYVSQTHATHTTPLDSARTPKRTKVNVNMPSEYDHPLLGLHDPKRHERLAAITAQHVASTASQFKPPPRRAYWAQRADLPPRADTAHMAMRWGRHAEDHGASTISSSGSARARRPSPSAGGDW